MNATNLQDAERRLCDERARLATVVAGAQAAIWEWNVETGAAQVDERWAAMLGYTVDELAPVDIDTWTSRVHPADRPLVRERLLQHYAGDADHHAFDVRLRHRDGSWVWIRAYGRASQRHDDGRALVMHGIHRDVTAEKRAESGREALAEELADSRRLLQTTLDAIADAVITTDADGIVRWLNPAAERMTGWPQAEAAGRPIAQVFVIVDEDTRMAPPDPVAACAGQGGVAATALQALLLARDGQEFTIEGTASPIRRDARADDDGRHGEHLLGVVLVFHDVSEQRRISREMTLRATHDPLTGLVNRAEFEARLQRVAMSLHDDAGTNALLYVDLDHFKVVNDACGHSVGDQLLLQVSALMRRCVRSRDTVARLGGDEFAVILEHCDVQQAQRIAQKLCDEMEDFRFAHDERRFRVGMSIGLVPFDRRWESVAAAIQAADASCYAAKAAGRNRVHVWVDADAEVTARHGDLQWVARLEQALDENRFELYGQRIEPIGKHSTGLHLEVLLRLREADGTIVPPGLFLPAAERFHLATRIDRWVIREVFARLDDRSNFANEVEMIAINLSGHSIGDRAFHRDVVKMIRAASFDVRKLCFEITETVAVTNLADAKLFIDEVRRMGVKIALDDFGAGASSFGYLKSLPVDFLKIDGSFITGLLDDALDDAAVRCFREVARVVGVQTIAEFVERDDVRDVLRAIGIDMAQGYLIHRPEPLSAMTFELA